MTISVVLIPKDTGVPLQTINLSWKDNNIHSHPFQEVIQNILHQQDYLETPLLRPRGDVAGLYAYYNVPEDTSMGPLQKNIRATRLAMACGLLSKRFYGPVVIVRSFGGKWENVHESEIYGACAISADLRLSIQQEIAEHDSTLVVSPIPTWLADAAQHNYHDAAELAKVISAMNPTNPDSQDEGDSDSQSDETDTSVENDANIPHETPNGSSLLSTTEFIAKSPLCLYCRKLSSNLCPHCEGAYFCNTDGRNCREEGGWSHDCNCPTWRLYSMTHRQQLSNFDGFFGSWQEELTSRPHQLSEQPYEYFLQSLGIHLQNDATTTTSTWWRTELGGWAGGQSSSASQVDASIRYSYAQGFAPIQDIPPERRVTNDDWIQSGLVHQLNEVGLSRLSSWSEYYQLRNISPSSPIALLCTFPLTIYHAIEQFGDVPVTVARMLQRPLRIHIVGAEKEINFLDLFQEVGFLLPDDLQLELVFVVREDMLPKKCHSIISADRGTFAMKIEYSTHSMVIGLVSGTYGTSTLDPNFDCGTGPPDMVIALNAGLYAYESWRSVVNYLYNHSGVVGVFSDYNEYSGVNCAAIGGEKCRQSLRINPFRQPRAMPVYSMNLPQFSNGFLYAFNEQELE